MKFKDLFNFRMSEQGKALKGDKTDADLEVSLEAQILPDDRVIEYEALEVGKEVFLIVKDMAPALIKDETLTLSDGQKIVVDAEGKISEIIPAETPAPETPVEAELSAEQKKLIELASVFDVSMLESLVNLKENGYYCLDFGVYDGKVNWVDLSSNTYKTLLSEQENTKVTLTAEIAKSVKLESEKVALTAQVELLQKLNDQKLPLKNAVKLEDEKPLTTYEKRVLKQ
jgi:hypothetical protein